VITVTVHLFSDFSEQSDQNSDQVSQNRTETNNLLRAIAEGQKRGTFGSQCTFTIRPNAARSNRGSIHSGFSSGSHTGSHTESHPESKTTKSLELAEQNGDDNRITLTCDETQVTMKPNLT
jgi:hypothetical protein